MNKVIIEIDSDVFQGLGQETTDKVIQNSTATTVHDKDGVLLSVIKDSEGVHTPIRISDEAKAKYLENPVGCPVCGSNSIDGSQVNVEGSEAFQEVSCAICRLRWQEIFKLVDVELLDV